MRQSDARSLVLFRPLAHAMKHTENFHFIAAHPVRHDEWGVSDDQFARLRRTAGAAEMWMRREHVGVIENSRHSFSRRARLSRPIAPACRAQCNRRWIRERGAPAPSSALSFPGSEFLAYARHFVISSEIAAIGGGVAGFDFCDLPRIQGDVILDGFGDEPIARAFGLFGEAIERVERRVVETHGKIADIGDSGLMRFVCNLMQPDARQ